MKASEKLGLGRAVCVEKALLPLHRAGGDCQWGGLLRSHFMLRSLTNPDQAPKLGDLTSSVATISAASSGIF